MKKLIVLLLLVFTMLGCSLSFAEEEYPAENYEMYYGSKILPIAFAQMGYGYVVDWYSIRPVDSDPKELLADVHEVDLGRRVIKPNPMHVYVKYEKDKSFKIGFRDNPETIVPRRLLGFNESYLNRGTSETGMLFPVGRVIYEGINYDENGKHKALYPAWPMLKPVGESGAPNMLKVREDTMYYRNGFDRGTVVMLKASGAEYYDIVFHKDHFVIERVTAENEAIQAKLTREEVGRKMYYEYNPRVKLVANHMGFIWHLSDEELDRLEAYGIPRG